MTNATTAAAGINTLRMQISPLQVTGYS
jgi:hypothetical protein